MTQQYTMNLEVAQLWASELQNGSHQPTPPWVCDTISNGCFCAVGVLLDIYRTTIGKASVRDLTYADGINFCTWAGVSPFKFPSIDDYRGQWRDRSHIFGEVSEQFETDGKTFPEIAQWLRDVVIMPEIARQSQLEKQQTKVASGTPGASQVVEAEGAQV